MSWLRVRLVNGEEHIIENAYVDGDSLIGDEWPPDDPKGIDRQFERYDLKGYPRRLSVHTDDIVRLSAYKSASNVRTVIVIGLVAVGVLFYIGLRNLTLVEE